MITLNTKVDRFRLLKAELQRIQAELEPLKVDLELAALNAGGRIILDNGTITVVESYRESVSIKSAREGLGTALDPYIKTTSFTVLRVS